MGKTRPVIRPLFPVLIGCILLLPSSSAFAQGLGDVLTTYHNATNGWITKILAYANNLFLLLAGIEFAWTAIILLFEQQSLEGWVAAFIKKLMAISFFYALLTYAQTWIPDIINSFTQIGQNVGGTGGPSPDGLIGDGWNLASKLFEAGANIKPNPLTDSIGFLFVVLFGAIAVVIIICFIAMALQFVMTQVEGYIVISVGMIFLGFGGSRWTSNYTERFLSTAVTTGIRIMTFLLIVGLGQALVQTTWTNAVTDIANMINKHSIPGYIGAAQQAFTLGAGVIIFSVLALRLPRVAGGVISGSAGLSAGDLAGTTSTLAGVGASALGLAAAPALAGLKAGAAGAGWAAKKAGGMVADHVGGALSRLSTARSSGRAPEMPHESGMGVNPPDGLPASSGQDTTGPTSLGFNDAPTQVDPPPSKADRSSPTDAGNAGMASPNSFITTADVGQPPPPSSGQRRAGGSFMDGVQKTAASMSHRLQEVEKGLVALVSDPQHTPDTLPPPSSSERG